MLDSNCPNASLHRSAGDGYRHPVMGPAPYDDTSPEELARITAFLNAKSNLLQAELQKWRGEDCQQANDEKRESGFGCHYTLSFVSF